MYSWKLDRINVVSDRCNFNTSGTFHRVAILQMLTLSCELEAHKQKKLRQPFYKFKKGSQVQFRYPTECVYPRSPALGLGLTAAVALMIAQIVVNVATGCICCRKGPRQSNSNWTLALICFVVSWFTFVIAFLLLLTGAALNDQHGEENLYFGSYCYVMKPGVFAGAALLSLASVVLGIVYYLILTSEKDGSDLWRGPVHPGQGGIAMGEPQIPPQNAQDPVFVHQDTYLRRQLA